MQRYSKKRDAILSYLCSTKEHPDAETILNALKPVYPDLSLGTVYRNLGQLTEAGLICTVGAVGGIERYDANVTPHPHAVCLSCGRVIDMDGFAVSPETVQEAEKTTGFRIVRAAFRFEGLCQECERKAQKALSDKNETDKGE